MALDWRSRIRVIGLRQVVPLQRNDSVTMDGFCDTDGQSPGRERREEGERGGGGGGVAHQLRLHCSADRNSERGK